MYGLCGNESSSNFKVTIVTNSQQACYQCSVQLDPWFFCRFLSFAKHCTFRSVSTLCYLYSVLRVGFVCFIKKLLKSKGSEIDFDGVWELADYHNIFI